MRIFYIFIIILVSGTLISCSKSSDNPGYIANLLYYNGKLYVGPQEVGEESYTNIQKIGVVEQKVDKVPNQSLTSNTLDEGTEIYKIKGKKDILLAEISDEKYQIFKAKAD
jgi:hypothetical protein